MAEYAHREREFNSSVGATIGAFAVEMVKADAMAKDAGVRRAIALAEEGNVEFKASSSVVGMDEGLNLALDVPLLTLTDLRNFVPDEARAKMSMTVSAHTENASQKEAGASVEGSGKAGWGPFSVGVKVSGHMSTSSSKKRSSDYTATSDFELVMKQGIIPEGLAMIVDAANKHLEMASRLNEAIVANKVNQVGQDLPDDVATGTESAEGD